MRTLGVIIPGVVNEDYLGEVYRGIADAAKQHRCSLMTSIQNPRRQDDLSHFLGRGGCDGAVLVVPYQYDQIIERCREAGRQCVLLDYAGDREAQLFPTVEVRNREGIVLVMQHLVELGHRRIAFITGAMEHDSAHQRLRGYEEGLKAAGIAYNPALVVIGSWLPPENYTASQQLFQLRPLPTAIVTSSDIAALATYRVARECGVEIGREISVTGFDDVRAASTSSPPLTTVRQPIYQLGQVAIDMLVRRLN
ncbi:MAG: substrate-binding domain-containing protein, partial [Chloroflexota bacterium]